METIMDLIHQAMFTTVKQGYDPREVDRFMEQLKDECRILEEKYRNLEQEVLQLRTAAEGK